MREADEAIGRAADPRPAGARGGAGVREPHNQDYRDGYQQGPATATATDAGSESETPKAIVTDTPEGHDCAESCVQAYYFSVVADSPCDGGLGAIGAQEECKNAFEKCGLACPGVHQG